MSLSASALGWSLQTVLLGVILFFCCCQGGRGGEGEGGIGDCGDAHAGGGEDNGEAAGVGGAMTDCGDAHTIHQVMPEALPKFHGQMMLMASLVPIGP